MMKNIKYFLGMYCDVHHYPTKVETKIQPVCEEIKKRQFVLG